MTLTARFVKEARRFALECAEGTAPPLIASSFRTNGQSCALGWVLRRSCEDRIDPWSQFHMLGDELRKRIFDSETQVNQHDAWQLVLRANNNAHPADRAAAVVFPLLALADALEAA